MCEPSCEELDEATWEVGRVDKEPRLEVLGEVLRLLGVLLLERLTSLEEEELDELLPVLLARLLAEGEATEAASRGRSCCCGVFFFAPAPSFPSCEGLVGRSQSSFLR